MCTSPKADIFVQSRDRINNTKYTSSPTSLSMINEPVMCNSFYELSSNNISFPSSYAFRETSDNSVTFEDNVNVPSIFYLNPKADCFVPNCDNPARGITTGKICSSINSIAGSVDPNKTSKDLLGVNGTDMKDDPYSIINNFKIKNHNRVIFAHLNINSLRNKFDMLSDIVKNKIDILCISETKLNDTFPSSNFFIPGYSAPYRLDRSGNGGGILLYVREDIPSKELKFIPIPNNMEGMFIEINLYKKKWLIGNFYNPCKSMICGHLAFLSKCLDHYLQSYDNVILLGDFNSEPTETAMHEFCQIYNLLNLIKVPTCFKNPQNP